jgi:hypothetical protein
MTIILLPCYVVAMLNSLRDQSDHLASCTLLKAANVASTILLSFTRHGTLMPSITGLGQLPSPIIDYAARNLLRMIQLVV